MEIYIIRHTPVAVTRETCYGQLNVALSDTYPEDIPKLVAKLPNQFDAIFCSPLDRCRQLSPHFKTDHLVFEPAIMEFKFGEWEGKKWTEIPKKELNEWMLDYVTVKPPNGENLAEMYARVSGFLEKLQEESFEKVLLITHGGTIRCIWAYILEMPLRNMFKIPVDFFEVFKVKLTKDIRSRKIYRKC